MLKRLVRRAGLLQGVDLRPEGHVLKTLWDKLKPLWSEVFRKRFKQELSQNEIGGIDGYICQLDDLDQGGDTFRYPLKRQKQGGGSTLKAGIELIGVERVALAMERLSEELARWDEVLDELSVA
jgi:hypothetical protein